MPKTVRVLVGGVVTVYPLVTPPGLIQLEAVPVVKAKDVNVPVMLLPEASFKMVTAVLFPAARP